MDNLVVRKAVRLFLSRYINYGYSFRGGCFRNQDAFADALSVRSATVSSWMNEKSDISLFTFLRICQVISVRSNSSVFSVVRVFLDVLFKSSA